MKKWISLLLVLLLLFLCGGALAAAGTLQLGSSGSEVKKLQQALNDLGYDTGGIDGKFGAATRRAVILYQSAHNLTADGKAGKLTLAALYAEPQSGGSASGTVSGGTTLSGGVSSSAESLLAGRAIATNKSTLQYGSSGSTVKKLQEALNKLGYDVGKVDGKFGLATFTAVMAFQRDNGLTADGLAGTQTVNLLYQKANGTSSSSGTSGSGSAVSSDPSDLFTETLREGASGNAVTAAQQQLKTLGYYTLSVDGKYGAGSIAAVRNFQSANGLTADGLLGRVTWNKLFSGSAKAYSGSSSSSSSSSGSDYTTLQSGSKGTAVKNLQQALKNLGWSLGVDGSYGTQTVSAVKSFQERNGLTANGIADAATQKKLYSGGALGAVSGSGGEPSNAEHGTVKGNNGATIHLLHWFNEVKPKLSTGATLHVYDPATGKSWNLRVISRGRHCDCEPLTAADTANMNAAFGTTTWTPKPVYVQLPSGTWSLAATHNTPHESYSIKDNNFDGHLCVHFLRDMEEAMANDPNYGVTNQNTIRKKWKELTGVTVD